LEILIDNVSSRIAGTGRGSDDTCVPRRACANEGFGSAACAGIEYGAKRVVCVMAGTIATAGW